jgi:hypothetical protein
MGDKDMLQMVSLVFKTWIMKDAEHDYGPREEDSYHTKMYDEDELLSHMFAARVLLKKLQYLNIDVWIPKDCLVILELCCNSSPGMIQLMTHRLLASMKANKKDDYRKGCHINSTDFLMAFPDEFPLMSYYPDVEKFYNDEWDNQKTEDGSNKVDTMEWWADVKTE